MRLALWDSSAVDLFVAALEGTAGFSVVRMPAAQCEHALASGDVDLALLTSYDVLTHTDDYDVVPAAALSSWRYPFARVMLRQPLGSPIRTIAATERDVQEAFVARVVLAEHYGQEPERVDLDPERLSDATVVVGDRAVPLDDGGRGLLLNLGQEWFELVNYPMVWGLFAMRKGEVRPAVTRSVRTLVRRAESFRDRWASRDGLSPDVTEYFAEDARLRFDDLATASLTELRQYLFFYKVLEEVPDVPIVPLEDDTDDEPEPLV